MAGFPKFFLVDLHDPGANGVHGAFCTSASGVSSAVSSVHNGSAFWLSSLFSEKSALGRSNLDSGGCTMLDEAYH